MTTCTNNTCTNTWNEEPPVAIFIANTITGDNPNGGQSANWGYYCGFGCALTDIGNELLPLIEATAPAPAVTEENEATTPEPTFAEDPEDFVTEAEGPGNGGFILYDVNQQDTPGPDVVPDVVVAPQKEDDTAGFLAEVWKNIEKNAAVIEKQVAVPSPQPVDAGDETAPERLVDTSELCTHLSEALAHDYEFNVSTTTQPISIGDAMTARMIYTLVNSHGTFIVTHDVDNIYVSFGEKFNFVAPSKDFIESGQYNLLKQALLAV